MRKSTIVSAMALSLISVGSITAAALPASAATHHAARAAGEDTGDGSTPPPTVGSSGGGGGGSSSSPSGGVATGAGGMAKSHDADAAPFLAAGAAGFALIGASAIARRRRTVAA